MSKNTVCRFVIALFLLAIPGWAKPLDNQTLLKLLAAEVGEEQVLRVIDASDTQFDTSPEAIAAPKKAGATPAVLTAVIAGKTDGGKAQAASGHSDTAALQPTQRVAADTVSLLRNGTAQPLNYSAAELRAAARGLGLGGAALYAVLTGPTSDVVLDRNPEFEVSLPSTVKPNSYLQLASFAVRKNGNREVMIGGGMYSVSIGIHPDRVIALSFDKKADQSAASEGQTLYRVKPAASLGVGQYALVEKLSGQPGLSGGQVSGRWYDFCVR